VSLLTLAVPVSVQLLINTVANTSLAGPLVVLSLTLFGLLLFSGLLTALREHLLEIFGRRFHARMTAEIATRAIFAQDPFFADNARNDVFNRYFDIDTVQKSVPTLLIGGFTVLLQAVSGFVLVSFYHPFFLAFNLIIISIGLTIWLVWGRAAMRSAIVRSHAKYNTARWLESIGASNGFYKSDRHVAYALDRSDAFTRAYVECSRVHFRRTFAQSLGFLLLYAAASSALLALGGWLVIQNQLTLGQLVAAELVLSAIFVGMASLGGYLRTFYDLFAGIEELSQFWDIGQEELDGGMTPPLQPGEIEFVQAGAVARGRPLTLDFSVPAGARVLAAAADPALQGVVLRLLKRHMQPSSGFVSLGGVDLGAIDGPFLRREIVVLQRPTIVDCTIRDYLQLSAPDAPPAEFLRVLEIVGLAEPIARLPEGLDTELTSTGWPLTMPEAILLKLAGAVLGRPRVLVLSEIYDLIPEARLELILSYCHRDSTVIYFSNRESGCGMKSFLWIDYDQQAMFDRFEDFAEARRGGAAQRQLPAGARLLPSAPTQPPETDDASGAP
jgi:putative ABC transport system ATP-binding protein